MFTVSNASTLHVFSLVYIEIKPFKDSRLLIVKRCNMISWFQIAIHHCLNYFLYHLTLQDKLSWSITLCNSIEALACITYNSLPLWS